MGETLQDFELARQERLRDGTVLRRDSRNQGTIYMFGYHAEMSLKLTYFRFRREPLTTEIISPLLRACLARATVLGVTTKHEAFHSLRF